jgi:hypothetical protein
MECANPVAGSISIKAPQAWDVPRAIGKREGIQSRNFCTTALASRVTTYTTIAGANAAVEGIRHLTDAKLSVMDLQTMHKSI